MLPVLSGCLSFVVGCTLSYLGITWRSVKFWILAGTFFSFGAVWYMMGFAAGRR